VTANGTAMGQSFFFVRNNSLLSKGTYTLSGCPSGGTGSTYCLYAVLDNTDYSTIKGDIGNGSSFTLNEDRYLAIHINISNGFTARNLTFKPMFNKGSTALPYSLYFRESLPIPANALDGFGQGVNAQYYNKIVLDPLEGVKKYVKKVGAVDLGTLTWTLNNNNVFQSTTLGTIGYNLLCAKYPFVGIVDGNDAAYEKGDKTLSIYINDRRVYIRDDSYTDAASFKKAMSGVMLLYELAIPTETDVSAYFTEDNLLRVEAGGTITAANEFEHEVPFTVEYMIKGA
jgi:hypothetical protein